jgi:transposase
MGTKTLVPDADALHLEALVADDRGITVVVATTGETAACPDCGQPSARQHSRRRRTVADLPWQGLAVRLDRQLRRFYCHTPDCGRWTFTERVPTVVAPYARRTVRLAEVVEAVACALGGEAGTRLLAALGLQASPDALLRTIRRASGPAATAPKVLGVDDWAWKKGRRYGTILVDLERRRVVDLLPDRSAESLARWLREHPGVEVVARDRAGAYADGIRQGAPEAVQVADRWHLAKNLGDAIEELLDRHRQQLRQPPLPVAVDQHQAPQGQEAPPQAATARHRRGGTQLERTQQARRAARGARYQQVVALRERGETVRAIARTAGVSIRTVQRFLAAGRFPERHVRRRPPSPLDPYIPYLDQQWAAGRRRGTVLWRELCTRGYTGARSTVYTYLYRLRRQEARAQGGAGSAATAATPVGTQRVSPRRATWLFLRPAADLAPAERQFLAALHERCADTATAYQLAQRFLQLLRERQRDALEPWLVEAEGSAVPELRRLAVGLRRDQPAVEAGLAEAWSNGQTEGQVLRLKLVRRTMYGRGTLDLLRQRVLRAA